MSHEFHNVRLQDPINWGWAPNHGLVAPWLPVPGFCGGLRWFEPVGRHHGTLTNMAPASAWKPSPRGGLCLQLDGVSNYVDGGNAPALQITGPLTIVVWVYKTDTSKGGLVDKWASGNGYALCFYSDDKLVFYIYSSTTDAYFLSTAGVSRDTWHQVVGVYDTSTIEMYLDGKELAGSITGTVPGAITDAGINLSLGRAPNTGDGYFTGIFDGPRIYKSALSPSEILAIYEDDLRGMREQLNRIKHVYAAAAVTVKPWWYYQHASLGAA